MDTSATKDGIIFIMSTIGGLIGWFTIFSTLVWPKIKTKAKLQRLKMLTSLHFFRYFGTTFLMVGLVTRKLPANFAYPTAIGDLIALCLAYIAYATLHRAHAGKPRTSTVLLFNIIGAADLLFAYITGPLFIKDPAFFGLAYLIPTFYVPLLLASHYYSFKTLRERPHE